jgi:hypothetical protein
MSGKRPFANTPAFYAALGWFYAVSPRLDVSPCARVAAVPSSVMRNGRRSPPPIVVRASHWIIAEEWNRRGLVGRPKPSHRVPLCRRRLRAHGDAHERVN